MSATDAQPVIRIRTTADDRKILSELRTRLGINLSSIIRLGLRRLHEQEFGRTQEQTAPEH